MMPVIMAWFQIGSAVIYYVLPVLWMTLRMTTFRRYGKNRYITPNISEYPGPIFTKFTDLVGIQMGMINLTFVWQSPKGRCYSNQLNLGAVPRRRHERPLAFNNGFDDREATFKRLNGNNPATSGTNLVSFRTIISQFTLLKRAVDSVAI